MLERSDLECRSSASGVPERMKRWRIAFAVTPYLSAHSAALRRSPPNSNSLSFLPPGERLVLGRPTILPFFERVGSPFTFFGGALKGVARTEMESSRISISTDAKAAISFTSFAALSVRYVMAVTSSRRCGRRVPARGDGRAP